MLFSWNFMPRQHFLWFDLDQNFDLNKPVHRYRVQAYVFWTHVQNLALDAMDSGHAQIPGLPPLRPPLGLLLDSFHHHMCLWVCVYVPAYMCGVVCVFVCIKVWFERLIYMLAHNYISWIEAPLPPTPHPFRSKLWPPYCSFACPGKCYSVWTPPPHTLSLVNDIPTFSPLFYRFASQLHKVELHPLQNPLSAPVTTHPPPIYSRIHWNMVLYLPFFLSLAIHGSAL